MVRGAFPLEAVPFNKDTLCSDDTIEGYLNTRSTNFAEEQRNLQPAMYAFIMAKSKWSAYEKFQYLWMSFNCFYFHYGRVLRWRIAHELEEEYSIDTIRFKNGKTKSLYASCDKISSLSTKDWNAVKNFALLLGLPQVDVINEEVSNQDKQKKITDQEETRLRKRITGDSIETIIASYWNKTKVTRDSLKNEHRKLSEEICDKTMNGRDSERTYCYLLTTYAYNNIRCRYFHGGRSIPMFSREDESQILSLELVNGILEDILDKYLFPSISRKDKISNKEEAIERLAILTDGDKEKSEKIFHTKFKGTYEAIKNKVEDTISTPPAPSHT